MQESDAVTEEEEEVGAADTCHCTGAAGLTAAVNEVTLERKDSIKLHGCSALCEQEGREDGQRAADMGKDEESQLLETE